MMGNIFIFSILMGLASALVLFPFTKKKLQLAQEKDEKQSFKMGMMITAIILLILLFFGFYYISNLDRNFSSLWIFAIVFTAIGALLSSGKEQMIKASLCIISLLFGIFLLTAFLFNADEKYQIASMKEKTEIKAFDETKTPASVPPQFARNKMKKAFGQVPNTSYYELGNLQIQKVNGEFVYIAPVEFSGFFKWLTGKRHLGISR